MKVLADRMATRAKEVAERHRQRVGAAWAAIPGVAVGREGDRLIVQGRGLVRRWLRDVTLRFARWNNR